MFEKLSCEDSIPVVDVDDVGPAPTEVGMKAYNIIEGETEGLREVLIGHLPRANTPKRLHALGRALAALVHLRAATAELREGLADIEDAV